MCAYVCLTCGTNLGVSKKCNTEQHFTKVHSNLSQDFVVGSNLCKKKVKELKTILQKQPSKQTKNASASTEASFKVVHILTKHKKPFINVEIIKEAMAESLRK